MVNGPLKVMVTSGEHQGVGQGGKRSILTMAVEFRRPRPRGNVMKKNEGEGPGVCTWTAFKTFEW